MTGFQKKETGLGFRQVIDCRLYNLLASSKCLTKGHKYMNYLKLQVNRLKGLVPHKLPVGMTEFDKFTDFIFTTYDLPDLPSYKHAIAAQVMHLGPQVNYVAPRTFAKSIRKAMANQIAYEVIEKIRLEEKAKQEAESAPPEGTIVS